MRDVSWQNHIRKPRRDIGIICCFIISGTDILLLPRDRDNVWSRMCEAMYMCVYVYVCVCCMCVYVYMVLRRPGRRVAAAATSSSRCHQTARSKTFFCARRRYRNCAHSTNWALMRWTQTHCRRPDRCVSRDHETANIDEHSHHFLTAQNVITTRYVTSLSIFDMLSQPCYLPGFLLLIHSYHTDMISTYVAAFTFTTNLTTVTPYYNFPKS